MLAGIITIENRIANFDGQLAVPLHGVARIDGEIEQRILHLVGIGIGVPETT